MDYSLPIADRITRNNIRMIAVATTMPMIWQTKTCSVVDQPVILEQILVATERTIMKAMIPPMPTTIRFIIPPDTIHKSPHD